MYTNYCMNALEQILKNYRDVDGGVGTSAL